MCKATRWYEYLDLLQYQNQFYNVKCYFNAFKSTLSVYIKRTKKVSYYFFFFPVKNTYKLIN